MSEKWCTRFTLAAVVHGLIVAIWSGLFLLDQFGITLNLARIVAGGSAGTWFTMGYLLYLLTGVLSMAAWGAIYYFLSKTLNKPLYSDKLALVHFILFNMGVIGATWLLGYAGFLGGSLAIAGKAAEIHPTIVVFVQPIGVFVAIGALSTLIGVSNILVSFVKKAKPETP